jgi:hypothetical protein
VAANVHVCLQSAKFLHGLNQKKQKSSKYSVFIANFGALNQTHIL